VGLADRLDGLAARGVIALASRTARPRCRLSRRMRCIRSRTLAAI